ncbi:MAG TPA: PAS domain-containing protein [Acidobacteriaceae bacterium]|nr:PAS domain-containing protein [Acidobacteriaceae bacterium]
MTPVLGMVTRTSASITEELFARGGEMGARMRALDWSQTALGPVESWPQALKIALGICLNSRFAIALWWGPAHVYFYNDAYIPLIGGKHPAALGRPASEVLPEVWDALSPMLEQVLQEGVASWTEDLRLLLERDGFAEECYFTFSFSPIRNETGKIDGMFIPVLETTGKIESDRRLHTLRELAALSAKRPQGTREACSAVLEVLSPHSHDIPFAAIYLLENSATGDQVVARLAGSTSSSQSLELPGTLDSSQESWIPFSDLVSGQVCEIDFTSRSFAARGVHLPVAPWGAPPRAAIVQPIWDAGGGRPAGFLLAGVSFGKRVNDSYRGFLEQVAAEISGKIRDAENRARERSLRAEAEAERIQIRELFMNAPAAILVTTGPEHRVVLANQRYLEAIGRSSAEEVLGKTILEILPEVEEQGFIELLNRVYRTGIPFIGHEVRALLRRGPEGKEEEAFFDFVYQPHRDAEGKVNGILIHTSEVTEKVQARRAVEEREEQFRVLADSIPQLAWMAYPNGSIDWYNQRWYEYTGTTFEEMQGWGWQALHDPEKLPEVVARYNQSLETGEPFEMEFPLRGADGVYRPFLTLALPVRDSEGNILRWFGTNTNMEAQQRAEAALRQSEKLAAVGRLASSIAHEINNPLEGVTNLIYLARGSAVSAETRTYLQIAEDELKRVSQITNQTLRFHKQQSAATPTDCRELLDSVLTLYRGKLSREGIRLQIEARDCPPMVCYAGEIRQVLANLIGNALDAMAGGGTLRIRLRPATNWRKGDRGIRFTICDSGHGIPPQTIKHIYEPFFTTRGETGTGLGLWVSAGIIDNHGGSIHVRSSTRPARTGTAFTLIFPGAIPNERVQ